MIKINSTGNFVLLSNGTKSGEKKPLSLLFLFLKFPTVIIVTRGLMQ